MEIRPNTSIAVIGAGTMGTGIAQVAAMAGHPAVVVDTIEQSLDRGRATLGRSLASVVKRSRLDAQACEAVQRRLAWTNALHAAADAVLVIEAIVERLDAKLDLFKTLEAVTGDQAILASNTSSLSVSELSKGVRRRDRFIGLHFFNPVPAMKLVEVVPAHSTALPVIAACGALMERWGKTPVIVRDVPGFIVNRVARPYYAEGFAALGEGLSAAAVDALMTGAGGFRMGPLALSDLIGQDINYAVACSVYDAYDRKTRFRPQSAQKALVGSAASWPQIGQGRLRPFGSPPPARVRIRRSLAIDHLGV